MTLAARLPELQPADLAAVGRAVAAFHADAPVADGDRALHDIVEASLAALDAAGLQVDGLRSFYRAALDGQAGELERRRRAGLVREGHGDLRAEDVVLGEPIRALDEVDASLRTADVGYDFASLVMDVARRDDDLARALVRGYRAAGGDPGGDRLLATLCSIRALVRAAQLAGERPARARELLAVAERFAWRARLPRVVCVIGHAASGKSTLAEALASVSGRTVLSSDRTRKLRAGVDPFQYAGAQAYGQTESREVYAELGRRAARSAEGAIVDATFRRRSDADAFAEHVANAGWIVCEAPREVLLERARLRALHGDSVADAGPEIVAAELARHGRIEPPGTPIARLETTRPVPELLARLGAALDAGFYGSDPQFSPDAPRTTAA